MYDKKNKVLFTDFECLVLSPEFKLPDENQVLLRIPRQNNMYSFNLENIVPLGGLACLITKAIINESNKWHRRLGYVNFKNLNKLVKGNLVRGLPSKIFQNDHTCVACQKGKQHKASCKAKLVSSISHSLQLLHMDLVWTLHRKELNQSLIAWVITDDFSRSENQANKHAGLQEANQNAGTEDIIDAGDSEKEDDSAQDYFRSRAEDAGVAPHKHPDLKTAEKPVDKEDQVFLDELERLKRQEKDANDAAEALRKEFSQETEDFAFYRFKQESKEDSEALKDRKSGLMLCKTNCAESRFRKVLDSCRFAHWKRLLGTKWVYRNKKDERGVVVRNKARLVAQGHRQEEGIDYDEVNGPSTTRFIDPKYPQKVYKVVKALYDLHQAPRAWYATLSTFLLQNGYRRGNIDKTLFIKKDKRDIILVQVYVDDIIFGSTKKTWCDDFEALMKEILKKFDFINVKTTSTPIETQKPLVKACYYVTPKTSHLSAVKRIFRYLKGKSKLGLWYLRVSSFDLEAYSDNDYAGANFDRKSTTGGCQFLGRRLISWQCKKQTIVATSTTEAEYVAAASCCGQVL
ncbi:putative ribonuclease H-like domain-containing protein [Tanacetum coccineum]|uniref:Ribonuclease H-like domain-containing protein n=1 Tax=Tanacetum coccineum TaxID=301880 RepID=A0ABQ5GMJ2_9ASTR